MDICFMWEKKIRIKKKKEKKMKSPEPKNQATSRGITMRWVKINTACKSRCDANLYNVIVNIQISIFPRTF